VKHRHIIIAALLSLALMPATANANNDLLSVGAGDTGFFDNDSALDLRLEYRWGEPLIWQIKPFVGLEGGTHGAVYALGGVMYDWAVKPHWYITPGIGAGWYHGGGGRDLGNPIEFRSQIEGAYEFNSLDRLAVAFSHTSNFGLDAKDPGTQALTLYYHMPLSRFTSGAE
jgi:lipid A 3-O-deacylase